MSDTMQEHRVSRRGSLRGTGLIALGGLMLTLDIPTLRLAHAEAASALVARSGLVVLAALIFWLAWRLVAPRHVPPLIPGRIGLATVLLYGLASLFFVLAVYLTASANLVFILAVNPIFTAIFARIFLGERITRSTAAVMATVLIGVSLIIHSGLSTGNLLGDLSAFCGSVLVAAAIVLSRGSGRDMGFAPLIGYLIPLIAGLFMMEGSMTLATEVPFWLFVNGLIVLPIAFFCLAQAPKYVPGPQVALFYLLETCLTPVWIWLLFGEEPTVSALIGGTLIFGALSTHAVAEIAMQRRRRRTRAA